MADGSPSANPNLRVAGGSSQVFALSDGDRITLYDVEGGQNAWL